MPAPAAVAITDVTVVDGTDAAPTPHATVVIVGDRIDAVGVGATPPRGATTIEGTEKFLIPGLIDMHGHLCDASDRGLALLVANGVTGVRDLGGDLAVIDRWREQIADR
ncbi:MAG TPA: hypothetical protein VKT18_08975, partial [Acidimicrobiales bacterium]|nr:hypothetical protein [Acidimicrobiales bacterium]